MPEPIQELTDLTVPILRDRVVNGLDLRANFTDASPERIEMLQSFVAEHTARACDLLKVDPMQLGFALGPKGSMESALLVAEDSGVSKRTIVFSPEYIDGALKMINGPLGSVSETVLLYELLPPLWMIKEYEVSKLFGQTGNLAPVTRLTGQASYEASMFAFSYMGSRDVPKTDLIAQYTRLMTYLTEKGYTAARKIWERLKR